MTISNRLAAVLLLIAVILLLGSVFLIADRGITPLYGITAAPSQFATTVPITAAPMVGRGGSGSAAPSTPSTAPGATLSAINLSNSARKLFDDANNTTSSAQSLHFDLMGARFTLTATGLDAQGNAQTQQMDLTFDASGYVLTGLRGSAIPLTLVMDGHGIMQSGAKGGNFDLHIILVDGVMYMQASSPTTHKATDWLAYPVNQMLNSFAGGTLPVPILDPNSGQIGQAQIDGLPAVNLGQISGQFNQLFDFGKYVVTSAGVDLDPDTAQFVTQIDLMRLLSSDDFAKLTGMLGAVTGGKGGTLDPTQVQQLQMVIGQSVKALDIGITHFVSRSNTWVTRVELRVNLAFDLSALGAPGTSLKIEVPSGALKFSNYNGQFALPTPPPNAVLQIK